MRLRANCPSNVANYCPCRRTFSYFETFTAVPLPLASHNPKKGAKLSISLIGQKGDRCVCFARTRSGQSWIFCGVRTHSPISSNVRNQLLKTSPAAPKKVKPHFLWYFATFFHYNLATDVKYESPHDWWRGCHQYFNSIKIREICLLVSTWAAKYNLSDISDARKIGKKFRRCSQAVLPIALSDRKETRPKSAKNVKKTTQKEMLLSSFTGEDYFFLLFSISYIAWCKFFYN